MEPGADEYPGHRFDYDTPIEETVGRHTRPNIQYAWLTLQTQMQALHDVVKAGYVRYIGMSSCWAYQCQFLIWSTRVRPSDGLPCLSPRYAECVTSPLSNV